MTAFQQRSVALEFVEKRRAAIPFGAEQIGLMLSVVKEFAANPRVILDLGCGDGILTKTLLTTEPSIEHAILIDHSGTMLEKAQESLGEFGSKCEFIEGDLTRNLCELIGGREDIDFVISGYAIHHLTHENKKSLYEGIYSSLNPGGMFINIEHVASADHRLEQLFDNEYVKHSASVQQLPCEQAKREYDNRPDKGDNILAPVELQTQWLRDIGFVHVDCYFKWFELAVFGGQKPAI